MLLKEVLTADEGVFGCRFDDRNFENRQDAGFNGSNGTNYNLEGTFGGIGGHLCFTYTAKNEVIMARGWRLKRGQQ